jgi:hypothetical protein
MCLKYTRNMSMLPNRYSKLSLLAIPLELVTVQFGGVPLD